MYDLNDYNGKTVPLAVLNKVLVCLWQDRYVGDYQKGRTAILDTIAEKFKEWSERK